MGATRTRMTQYVLLTITMAGRRVRRVVFILSTIYVSFFFVFFFNSASLSSPPLPPPDDYIGYRTIRVHLFGTRCSDNPDARAEEWAAKVVIDGRDCNSIRAGPALLASRRVVGGARYYIITPANRRKTRRN